MTYKKIEDKEYKRDILMKYRYKWENHSNNFISGYVFTKENIFIDPEEIQQIIKECLILGK